MSARFVVVEIERDGTETSDNTEWATWQEAEAERFTLARIARSYMPRIGSRYEVREWSA